MELIIWILFHKGLQDVDKTWMKTVKQKGNISQVKSMLQ